MALKDGDRKEKDGYLYEWHANPEARNNTYGGRNNKWAGHWKKIGPADRMDDLGNTGGGCIAGVLGIILFIVILLAIISGVCSAIKDRIETRTAVQSEEGNFPDGEVEINRKGKLVYNRKAKKEIIKYHKKESGSGLLTKVVQVKGKDIDDPKSFEKQIIKKAKKSKRDILFVIIYDSSMSKGNAESEFDRIELSCSRALGSDMRHIGLLSIRNMYVDDDLSISIHVDKSYLK